MLGDLVSAKYSLIIGLDFAGRSVSMLSGVFKPFTVFAKR